MSFSHNEPLNPGGQVQVNPLIWSLQVPPFLQGFEAHSSMFSVQCIPEITSEAVYTKLRKVQT